MGAPDESEAAPAQEEECEDTADIEDEILLMEKALAEAEAQEANGEAVLAEMEEEAPAQLDDAYAAMLADDSAADEEEDDVEEVFEIDTGSAPAAAQAADAAEEEDIGDAFGEDFLA